MKMNQSFHIISYIIEIRMANPCLPPCIFATENNPVARKTRSARRASFLVVVVRCGVCGVVSFDTVSVVVVRCASLVVGMLLLMVCCCWSWCWWRLLLLFVVCCCVARDLCVCAVVVVMWCVVVAHTCGMCVWRVSG